jgi:hypothetical protein
MDPYHRPALLILHFADTLPYAAPLTARSALAPTARYVQLEYGPMELDLSLRCGPAEGRPAHSPRGGDRHNRNVGLLQPPAQADSQAAVTQSTSG